MVEISIAEETWKPVVGVDLYMVSCMGRVRSLDTVFVFSNGRTRKRTGKILKLTPDERGRPQAHMFSNGKQFTRTVSGIVAKAFIGLRPHGMECCHNNGNHADNRVENLRWDTHINNLKDQILHGTSNHGCRNPSAKITYEIAEEIRAARAANKDTYGSLANRFGLHKSTIYAIIKRELWQDANPLKTITKSEVRKFRGDKKAFLQNPDNHNRPTILSADEMFLLPTKTIA